MPPRCELAGRPPHILLPRFELPRRRAAGQHRHPGATVVGHVAQHLAHRVGVAPS
jgi:hypothetical protein